MTTTAEESDRDLTEATPSGEATAELAVHHSHVTSPRLLISVFAALVGLTLLTVVVANFPLGEIEILASLGIASLKATLVAAYFMHLRYDKSFHSVLLFTSIVCVALFLALTLADVNAYQPDIKSSEPDAVRSMPAN